KRFSHTASFPPLEQFPYNGYPAFLVRSQLPVFALQMFATSTNELLLAIEPSTRGLLVPFVVLLAAILVAVSFVILFNAVRRARGTTLLAPFVWSFISLALVVPAYLYLMQPVRYFADFYRREGLWLIALCSSFCPLLALLGAKRPQNRMWQWIVVSFW